MIIEVMRSLVGVPPVGFEWLEYVVLAGVFALFCRMTYDFIAMLSRSFGGR